jgi:hypothetical protein
MHTRRGRPAYSTVTPVRLMSCVVHAHATRDSHSGTLCVAQEKRRMRWLYSGSNEQTTKLRMQQAYAIRHGPQDSARYVPAETGMEMGCSNAGRTLAPRTGQTETYRAERWDPLTPTFRFRRFGHEARRSTQRTQRRARGMAEFGAVTPSIRCETGNTLDVGSQRSPEQRLQSLKSKDPSGALAEGRTWARWRAR